MAEGHRFLIFSFIAIAFFLIISTCNSYPVFNELAIPPRSTKGFPRNDVNRYVNRMKQYYETMAHLRYWRRDINESDEDDDENLHAMLRQYKNLNSKR
ncbi:unnamed protein product [Adineta steineri]|uniref:Uncharacterized protein n=1 Tax=Adineta steineri TaxID=433720 RepID=A0A813Z3X5_9BILA|nr:unnamed protein product [Adineta steineri]